MPTMHHLAAGLALALTSALALAGCAREGAGASTTRAQDDGDAPARAAEEAPAGGDEAATVPTADEDRFAIALLYAAYEGERELAELATDEAESERVVAHAEDLLDDYERTIPEVEEAADELDIDLEEGEGLVAQITDELGRVYGDQRAMLAELEGAEFDRAYLESLAGTHEATLAELERIRPRLEDDAAGQLVEEQTPVIDRHLERARDVADREDIELER